MPHTVYITGILNLDYINVRDKPGVVGTTVIYKPLKGTTATASAIQDDPRGDRAHQNPKVYRWFKLQFEDGTVGWARDDLIAIEGDLTHLGYGHHSQRVRAYDVDYVKDEPAPKEEPKDPITPPNQEPKDPITPPNQEPKDPKKPVEITSFCHAVVKNYAIGSVNLRADATTASDDLDLIDANTVVQIIGKKQGIDDSYNWLQVRLGQMSGYIREDLLAFDPACVETLPSQIAPTTPVPTEPIHREKPNEQAYFNEIIKDPYTMTQGFTQAHKGIDLAAVEGVHLYASGDCTVTRIHHCKNCTSDKPNSYPDYPIGDSRIINDPDWGYGYGHFVFIQHDWASLPTNIREYLKTTNMEGTYIYLIYAHLKTIDVTLGKELAKGDKIGTLGNTGNSTGAHLHLEVVVSKDANRKSLYGLPRLNPLKLFNV